MCSSTGSIWISSASLASSHSTRLPSRHDAQALRLPQSRAVDRLPAFDADRPTVTWLGDQGLLKVKNPRHILDGFLDIGAGLPRMFIHSRTQLPGFHLRHIPGISRARSYVALRRRTVVGKIDRNSEDTWVAEQLRNDGFEILAKGPDGMRKRITEEVPK
jgi:hypothetical protein